jgi:hypothetical protein
MVTRRSILGGAAAAVPLALGSATTAAEAASSAAVARRGSLRSGTVLTPQLALTALSVSGDAQVRLRTGTGWQPWLAAGGCPAGQDGVTSPARALVPATGTVEYQVRTASGAPVDVTEIRTAKFTAQPAVPLPLPPSVHSADRPRYLSRAGWGADESLRYNPDGTLIWPPAFFPVQTLTVHHSGENEPAPLPDPVAHVRSIYYNQAVGSGYGDIGYHLLIDGDGTVYEGRYSDPDRIPVFGPEAGPDALPQMVNAAHVGGFNAGNIGICVLGNFVRYRPAVAAVHSLTVVLALLAKATRLDPTGTTDYVNPVSGATATLPTIAGHKEWNIANPAADPTQCVGDYLFVQLPKIRREVAALTGRLP